MNKKEIKNTLIVLVVVFTILLTIMFKIGSMHKVNALEVVDNSYVDGMFIVPMLVDDYTQSEFDYMFQKAKDVGIDRFIIQYSVEYYSDEYYIKHYEDSGVIDKIMNSAKKYDIDIYFGTQIADDLWFEDYKDTSFLMKQEKISEEIVDDIYNKYYTDYSDVFKGYYLTFEINNIDFVGETMNNMLEFYYKPLSSKIKRKNEDFNIIISPLTYAPEYTDSTAFRQALSAWNDSLYKILDSTDINVIAPQDCLGNGVATLDEIQIWFEAMQKPFEDYNKTNESKYFLANNENYDMNGSGYMDLSKFINNMNTLGEYTSNNISFSVHKLLPKDEQDFNNKYYNAYKYYYDTGEMKDSLESTDNLEVNVMEAKDMLTFNIVNNSSSSEFTKYSLYADSKLIAERLGDKSEIEISTLIRPGSTYTLEVKDAYGNSTIIKEYTVGKEEIQGTSVDYETITTPAKNGANTNILEDNYIGEYTEWVYNDKWYQFINDGEIEMEFDLGEYQNVHSIDIYMMEDRDAGIYLPDSIDMEYNTDYGYKSLGKISLDSYAYEEGTTYKLHINIDENTDKIKLVLNSNNLNKNIFLTEVDIFVN